MAHEVKIPKLGLTMDEAFVLQIFVSEGDVVHVGDKLFEIETDKSTSEIESEYEGTVLKICVEPEETYPLGEVMMVIGDPE